MPNKKKVKNKNKKQKKRGVAKHSAHSYLCWKKNI